MRDSQSSLIFFVLPHRFQFETAELNGICFIGVALGVKWWLLTHSDFSI